MNGFGLETLVTLPSTLNLANGNEKSYKVVRRIGAKYKSQSEDLTTNWIN